MISCEKYDFVEIACMYRYPVKLTIKSAVAIEGVAIDTQRNELKEECIKVNIDDESTMLIVLNDILKLEVLVDNPHFSEVMF